MKQLVLPIKDTNILHKVGDTLLHNFHEGRRNYTVFQVDRAILLQVSDVLALRRSEIYKISGNIKKNAYICNEKTGRPNISCLKPVRQGLIDYFSWLDEQSIQSGWLSPSSRDHSRHITERQFYKIMAKTGDSLEINYLRTHSAKKAGAYHVYTQTHYNIGLVISPLNHTSEAITSKYLGLDQASREKILDEVRFD